jgi:hypothetical protein
MPGATELLDPHQIDTQRPPYPAGFFVPVGCPSQETDVHTFHPFTSDDEIAAIARGLIDRTLPKASWTHAAHFASALWLLHSGVECFREMPRMIRAYNEVTGVANTDTSGYHETITMASLRAARAFLSEIPARPLFETCNALLASPLGETKWLLAYWSRPLLFSIEARRVWIDADLKPFPFKAGLEMRTATQSPASHNRELPSPHTLT